MTYIVLGDMMKKKKILILVVMGLLLGVSGYIKKIREATPTLAEPSVLLDQVIVIDPGHGGLDNGASFGKTKEDELNLKISLALKEELEKRGAIVYLTRENDEDLTHRNYNYSKQDDMYLRALEIDKYEPLLFVSIHLNASSSSSAWGSQVFYYHRSSQGKELAKIIHQSMKEVTGTRKDISSSNFYILRSTKALGVLVECGFLSNGNERGQLRNSQYHQKLAVSISDGIEDYLKQFPQDLSHE